jgi:hypothetical protein
MFRFFMLLRWWFAHDSGGLGGVAVESVFCLKIYQNNIFFNF